MKHHLSVALASLFLLGGPLMAGNFTWDGSTSGNWGTGTNWSGGSAPTGSTDVLTFPATGVTNLTMVNNLAAALNFNKLTFAQGGYVLTGSSIDLVANGVTNPSIEATNTSGAETLVNLPITVLGPLTLSAAAGADLHLGANADLTMNNNHLTLNAAPGGQIELDGVATGTTGTTLTGGGTFIFDASQNMAGTTSLQAGTLVFLISSIAGPLSTAEGTTINSIKGVVNGGITINGNLDLGFSFTVNGNLVFGPAVTAAERVISFSIGGTLPGFDYDQIEVSGNLSSGSHKIALNITKSFPPGTEFILINKTSAGPIATATKFRKPDGTEITEGATGFYGSTMVRFSYFGGDGNDFTATVVTPPLQAVKDWDGGSTVDNLWSTAANWSTDTLPIAGQALRFGSVSTLDVVPLHDLPGYVGQFLFAGTGGFTLRDADSAAPVLNYLVKGMTASQATNLCVLEQDLALAESQTWALTGSGGMRIHETNQTDLGALNLTFNVAPSIGTPPFEMNGVLVGTGNIIKIGPGVLQLGGPAANTFTGTTTINQGEVRLTKTSGNALLGNITIGDGTNTASLTTTVTQKIADTAVVTVKPNGSFLPGQNETIGGLVIDGGTVNAGLRTITMAGDLVANTTATFTAGGLSFSGSQNISTAAGTTLTLNAAMNSTTTKIGTGTLELLKDSSGALTISEGTVHVYDGAFLPNLFTLQSGGTLVGQADFGTINAAAGGTLMTDDAGDITCDSFTGGSTAIFRPNLDAATLLHMTTGVINLASTRLNPILSTVPAPGTQFMIVQNTSASAITSRFANLSGAVLNEGATFSTPLAIFKISYVGGTGNDVVLTAQLPTASATTRVWDGGGGADTNWMTATNWVGDVAPQLGDSLEFPAAHVTSINNFPAGMTFGSISFTEVPTTTARIISGNAIQLLGNLGSALNDNASRVVDISLPITFLNAATVTNTGSRLLRFNAAVAANGSTLTLSGDGSASQRVIRFLGSGLISGPGKVVVDGNASADLGGSLTHAYAGGTEVKFGSLTGSGSSVVPHGLTVGDGVHTASVNAGSSSALVSNVVVNAKGTLSATSMSVTSLTLNGIAGTPATVSVTNLTLTTALTVDAGDSVNFSSLTAPALTQNNGVVTIGNSTTIAGDIRLQSGNLTLPNGSLAGRVQVDAGTLTQTGTLSVSGSVQVNGGTLNGGGIDFTGGGLHAFEVATTASLQTLGDAAFTDQVEKTGSGLLTVTTTLQAGSVKVSGGIFRNDSSNISLLSASQTAIILNGGQLQGNGTVGAISVLAATGSQISPGASPGRITAPSLAVTNGKAVQLNFEVNTVVPASGYDQILLSGPVPALTLSAGSSATVQLSFSPTFVAPIGTELVLISMEGTNPITGTFVGKPQNFVETVGGISVRYSYTGGTGNDFTVTLLTAPPAGEFRVWDGGGTDSQWMTAANWTNDIAPLPGDSLRFPNGAARLSNNNNFPANTTFGTIKVEADYSLSGATINLQGDVQVQSPGTTALAVPLQLDQEHAIILTGAGSLIRSGATTLTDQGKLTLRNNSSGEIDHTGRILVSGITDAGVVVDGTGLVKYNATNGHTYVGETWVKRGILQLTGAFANEVPGNLRIGGAGFTASVENPGGTVSGRISDTADLILEVGGTHTLTGATPLERITHLIMRGGSLTQSSGGQLIVLDRILGEGATPSVISTPVFLEASAAADIDLIDVATGSSLTLASSAGFLFNGTNNPKIRRTGGGKLIIQGTLTVTELDCWEGTTVVAGPSGQISGTTILNGGTVAGNGTLSGLSKGVSAGTPVGSPGGGTLAPSGAAGTGTGLLQCAGNLQPVTASHLAVKIGGTTAVSQHDQIQVNGTALDLNRCALDLSLFNNFVPTAGQTFTIINKISGGSPSPTPFAGKDEGSTFTAAGQLWRITYVGGDGNDVVLTAQGPATTLSITNFNLASPAGGAAGKQITATLSGPAGSLVSLQASSDLGNTDLWQTIATATSNSSGVATFNFTDNAATAPRRFYRFIVP